MQEAPLFLSAPLKFWEASATAALPQPIHQIQQAMESSAMPGRPGSADFMDIAQALWQSSQHWGGRFSVPVLSSANQANFMTLIGG